MFEEMLPWIVGASTWLPIAHLLAWFLLEVEDSRDKAVWLYLIGFAILFLMFVFTG